ncbi:GRIP and coiled-coil domain-containing protein 2 [Actinomortierella ambigua]|nr:GRIP and coiled-coil domain-containing protein 2 [Actinomortierella ambigua]
MFNTFLKKASEVETQIGNSIAALAGEPGTSRPGSPSAVRRQVAPAPGSNPNSAAPLRKMSKDVDRLEEEKKALREELEQALAVIKAMRGSLEDKATKEFLTDRADENDENRAPGSIGETNTVQKPDETKELATNFEDPLGASTSPSIDAPPPSAGMPVSQQRISSEENGKVVESTHASQSLELQAQVAELTQQIVSLRDECQQKDDSLAKQKSEHEDKMKKMKAIFAAANKSINEYRQQIAAKDEEIATLKAMTESAEQQQQPSSTAEDQSQLIEDLQAQLKSQAEASAAKLEQMENKLKNVNSQLDKLKEEYVQYKQRASTLLQKQRATTKADEQGDSPKLKSQITLLEQQIRKRTALDHEHQQALDQIASLETSRDMVRRLERQNSRLQKDLEKALEDVQRDRDAAEARIASLQELHIVEIQGLKTELSGAASHVEDRLARKEEELSELHRILERSEADLTAARSEIQKLTESLQAKTMEAVDPTKNSNGHLKISTAGLGGSPFLGPKSASSQQEQESPVSRPSSSLSGPTERQPVYAARPLVDRSPFLDNSGALNTKGANAPMSAKEREYLLKLQQLTELLNESEANNQRLLDQEKVLKEEIRSLDRSERRQNLSVDYLKNIVLKFLETSDREPLIPVLSTVLQLSPEEVATLKKKAVGPTTPSLVPVLGGLFSK